MTKKNTPLKRLMAILPAKMSLNLQYKWKMGVWPDLNNPKNFNEKVQYRKIHDNNDLFAIYSDKVLVKDFVAQRIGKDHVIPTLWCGKQLPPIRDRNWPKPFVIKANHGSGSNIFVTEKDTPDWPAIEKEASSWLRQRYRPHLHERHYDKIDRQLLIEPYIGGGTLPSDHKFHVFGGRVEFIIMYIGRGTDMRAQMFDREWNKLNCRYYRDPPDSIPPRPKCLPQMIEMAEALGKDFCFVRVDLYEIDGHPLFGEMTFTPGSGFRRFEPKSFDVQYGKLWNFPIPKA